MKHQDVFVILAYLLFNMVLEFS